MNKRNVWTTRLLLEETQHDDTAWLTLTYNDEHLPQDSELNKNDYRLWLKRLRKEYHPKKIRYYICGEYGTNYDRPHFHAVIFGLSFNYSGLAEYYQKHKLNLYPPDVVKMLDLWGKGNIHFVKPSPALMSYACSHLTKAIPDDTAIKHQQPEFHAMSGGLGKNAMHAIISWLSTEEGIKQYKKEGDVPSIVRINKKMRPIGKYLRNIIRRQLYLEESQPDSAVRARALRELAKQQDLGKEWKELQREKDRLKARQLLTLNSQRKQL